MMICGRRWGVVDVPQRAGPASPDAASDAAARHRPDRAGVGRIGAAQASRGSGQPRPGRPTATLDCYVGCLPVPT